MIKQTLEVGFDPGPLLLSGPNVAFSASTEIFWKGGYGTDQASSFVIGFRDIDGEYNELTFRQTPHGIDLEQMRFRSVTDSPMITFSAGMELDDAVMELIPSNIREIISADGEHAWTLKRNRCFFEIVATAQRTGPSSVGPYPALSYTSTDLLHVPGLRDNPARFYPATQVGPVFPGVFQSYIASIIQSWTDTKDPRLGELGVQLQELGLTWKVATQRIDDTRVALRVGRLPKGRRGGSRDLVNIADVGLGISQVLPVLVALLTASRRQYVYLEQPEIHLHPRAQVALAEIIMTAAMRGVRVICETHSYLLLRAIQEAAVRLEAPEDTVGLNWFMRDRSGATRVESAYLADNGSFDGWPNDFADVEMDIEDRYLQAVIRAEKSKG